MLSEEVIEANTITMLGRGPLELEDQTFTNSSGYRLKEEWCNNRESAEEIHQMWRREFGQV